MLLSGEQGEFLAQEQEKRQAAKNLLNVKNSQINARMQQINKMLEDAGKQHDKIKTSMADFVQIIASIDKESSDCVKMSSRILRQTQTQVRNLQAP